MKLKYLLPVLAITLYAAYYGSIHGQHKEPRESIPHLETKVDSLKQQFTEIEHLIALKKSIDEIEDKWESLKDEFDQVYGQLEEYAMRRNIPEAHQLVIELSQRYQSTRKQIDNYWNRLEHEHFGRK